MALIVELHPKSSPAIFEKNSFFSLKTKLKFMDFCAGIGAGRIGQKRTCWINRNKLY